MKNDKSWRGMLLKDNDGDWGVAVAAWRGMKKGQPGVPGICFFCSKKRLDLIRDGNEININNNCKFNYRIDDLNFFLFMKQNYETMTKLRPNGVGGTLRDPPYNLLEAGNIFI